MQSINKLSVTIGETEYSVSDWDRRTTERFSPKEQEPPTPEMLEYYKRVNELKVSKPRIFTYEEARWYVLFKANEKLSKFNKEFFCNPDLAFLYKALTLYFTANKAFEAISPSFSLSKGIFIQGDKGTGKTFALSLFVNESLIQNPQFYNAPTANNFINCSTLLRLYKRDGENVILKYTDESSIMSNGERIFPTATFDELSEKTNGKNYGNETNVMREILEGRYDNFINQGQITHLTSNIKSQDDLIELFGDRLFDRIKEMFNIIPLDGDSLRN